MNAEAKNVVYVQFGSGSPGPFVTFACKVKTKPLPAHIAGLAFSVSGRGARIPTAQILKLERRWRRIYTCKHGYVDELFIVLDDARIPVHIPQSKF